MSDGEREVKTVFTIADNSTGPLKQVTKASQETEKAVEKARTSAEKKAGPTWMQKLSDDERKQLQSIHEARSLSLAKKTLAGKSEEQTRADEERHEMKTRRSRTRGLRLEEQGSMVQARGAEMIAMGVGGGGDSPLGKLTQMAAKAELLGFGMSALGGKMGSSGVALTKMATQAVGVLAAAEAGFSIGEKLDEYFSISDRISGLGTEEAREKANNDYAKSMGYLNAERYSEVTAAGAKIDAEDRLRLKAEQVAEHLGGMPAEKTGAAMLAYKHAMLLGANRIAGANDKLEEVVKAIEEAASASVPTWLAQTNAQASLNEKYTKAAADLGAMPMKATAEEQHEYNEKLARAAESLGLMAEQIPGAIKSISAMAEARGSYGNTFNKFREDERRDAEFDDEIKNQLKIYKINGKGARHSIARASSRTEDMIRMTGEAMKKLKSKGLDANPEMAKEYLGKLKSKELEKENKYFDFRGSRFDITQQFAQGFDPDRISAAFSNDLANMGEHKLQSGLSPLFGIR